MRVRLWEDGDFEPKANFTWVGKSVYALLPLAYHCPISHWAGEPCIVILPKGKKWGRMRGVNAKNVVEIINHESLHCALMKIGEERGFGSGLDKLLTKLILSGKVRRSFL
jgi:hypothetical protein